MGGTILVLSSRVATDEALVAELERSGYTVLSAEEPSQGLVHVRAGGIDAIIVDLRGDCGEVDDFFTGLAAEDCSPPFILVSSSPSAPVDSARLGAAAFFPRPCHTGDLDSVLTRMVDRGRSSVSL